MDRGTESDRDKDSERDRDSESIFFLMQTGFWRREQKERE